MNHDFVHSVLATQTVKTAARTSLASREAEQLTGIARFPNADFGSFTVHRLIAVLGRLDKRSGANLPKKLRRSLRKEATSIMRSLPTPFRWNGGDEDPLISPQRDVNRLFDEASDGARQFSLNNQSDESDSVLVPQVNLSETEDEIRVTAEMPGVRPDELEVALNGALLTIRAEKKSEREEARTYHFTECRRGTFERALLLPFQIDPDHVHANFANGVLTVSLQKAADQQRSRRIEVNVGAGAAIGETTPQGRNANQGQTSLPIQTYS